MDNHILEFILSSEKDEIESKISHRDKFNQGGESPVYWKVQDINERSQRKHK